MKVKIALAQINPILGDIRKNIEKHVKFIEKAIKEKADVIVFPELSLTGYNLKDLTMEVAMKPFDPLLSPIFSLSNRIDISIGFVEKGEDDIPYNSAMYIENENIKNIYRKIYLPTHGMFQELRFFGKGSKVKVFDTKFGKVSTLICRDFFHPSLLFLSYAAKADFILAMSNMPLRGLSGEIPGIQKTVEIAADTYANFFGQFIIFINRVGFEDGLGFYGGSFVESPLLTKTAFAGILKENITFAEIDTKESFFKKQGFPLLREEDFHLIKRNLDEILSKEGQSA